jgi:hypothetical protein
MQAYLDWFPGDRAIQGARNALANRLLDIYERTHSSKWRWFEKSLSYSNADLSQALDSGGVAEQQPEDDRSWDGFSQMAGCRAAPRRRGDFCANRVQRLFSLKETRRRASISSQWRHAQPSRLALRYTGSPKKDYGLRRRSGFSAGFWARTTLQVPLYDAITGGCRDGLHPDRINENQGAESTLSFLMALLEMHEAKVTNARERHLEMSSSS